MGQASVHDARCDRVRHGFETVETRLFPFPKTAGETAALFSEIGRRAEPSQQLAG
jgi:hypothetical protein